MAQNIGDTSLILHRMSHSNTVMTGLSNFTRRHQLPWRILAIDDWERVQHQIMNSATAAIISKDFHLSNDQRTELHMALGPRAPLPPVINCQSIPQPGCHPLWFDDQAVGREAARHLAEKGYRHFACHSALANLTTEAHPYRLTREQAFRDEVQRMG